MAPEHYPIAGTDAAEVYERYFVPAIFRGWAERLLETAAPAAGERVLDVACGTGVVARLAARAVGPGGRVVGVDASRAMLDVARAQPAEDGAAPVEWLEGSAGELPLPDASFDLVLCQQGLQFFPERPAALRQMRRVLVPGGRVALSVWRAPAFNPVHQALHEAVLRRLGTPVVGHGFSLSDAGDLQRLLEGAGFREVQVAAVKRQVSVSSPEEFVRHSVHAAATVAPYFTGASPAARDEVAGQVWRDMSGTIERYTADGALAFPMEAHFATGRRASRE